MNTSPSSRAVSRFVWTVSIAIPLVVAGLFMVPAAEGLSEADLERVYLLPRLNALLNGTAFCCLALSLASIRKGNVARHKQLNTAALGLSALFLISYVAFHLLTESTRYGAWRIRSRGCPRCSLYVVGPPQYCTRNRNSRARAPSRSLGYIGRRSSSSSTAT